MENQNKSSNSIKNELIPLAFHQIDIDWEGSPLVKN